MKTITKIDAETLELLKKHGFQWFKDSTTDRVEASCIENVIPAENGFTVVYNATSVFKYSTASVEKVELPDDLEGQWIRVYWNSIEDQK